MVATVVSTVQKVYVDTIFAIPYSTLRPFRESCRRIDLTTVVVHGIRVINKQGGVVPGQEFVWILLGSRS